MLTKSLAEIFERDLKKLKDEIMLYTSEEDLWNIKDGISNSGGNLCLHLIGNLNHFIGATLGNTGYVRQRDKEFSLKNIPRQQLAADIDKTMEAVKATLAALNESELEKEFPLEMGGRRAPTGFILLHLSTHFNYHLGQINYHRRIAGG